MSGWEGDKETQDKEMGAKQMAKAKKGWPAERAKEIDRHGAGCKKAYLGSFSPH